MSSAETETKTVESLAGASAGLPPGPGQPPRGELALLHHSLAEYFRSGLPLPRALAALGAELRGGRLRSACARIAADVDVGTPFAEAYARHGAVFPPVYRALVEAGQRGGAMSAVLDEIACHASLVERVRQQLRRQLEAPLWGAAMVIGVALFVACFVAPLPPIEVLIGPSNGGGWSASELSLPVGLALLVAGALVVVLFAWLRRPLDAAGPAGLRYRLPVLGRLHADAAVAGFAATAALLLRRRMPLERALALCAETAADAGVRAAAGRMAAAAGSGASASEALARGGLIPASLLWFVDAAAASGGDGAARALDDIAALYRQRVERAAERAGVYAVPLLQLAAGVVVLVLALGYAFPGLHLTGALWGS